MYKNSQDAQSNFFWKSTSGMCAPKDPEEELGNISSVGNLKDAIPDLFKVLTEEEDMMKRWTSYTYLSSDVKPGSNIMRINGESNA